MTLNHLAAKNCNSLDYQYLMRKPKRLSDDAFAGNKLCKIFAIIVFLQRLQK